MLSDRFYCQRDQQSSSRGSISKTLVQVTLLCTSRDRESLAIADKISAVLPEFLIIKKHISNGHCDPLHGFDKDSLPDLVLFMQSGDSWEEEISEYANRQVELRPPMIMIGSKDNPAAMRAAMKAGARDFLTEPVQLDELIESIGQIVKEIHSTGRQGAGNLIAIMNTKGGSGASLLASNIAHMLTAAMGQSVVLIDLDMQFGSPGQYLDLTPKRGLIEALAHIEELDEFALDGYLLTHESGLRVMSAESQELLLNEESLGIRLEMLLDLLGKNFDQIIVDIPRHINSLTTAVLERADKVVLVIQQSLTHISDATRLVNIICQDLQIDKTRIVPVVNRYQKNTEVSLSDIEKAFRGVSPIVVTNDFERVNGSLNNGIPLYTFARSAQITKGLLDLSAELAGMSVPEKKGIIERLKARL